MSAADDAIAWRMAQARSAAADDIRLRYTPAPGIACGAILHSRPGSKQAPYGMASGGPQGVGRPQTARLPARSGQALAPTTLAMWGKDATRGFAYGMTAPSPCLAAATAKKGPVPASATPTPCPGSGFRPISALVTSLSARSPSAPSAPQPGGGSQAPVAAMQRSGGDLGAQPGSGGDRVSLAAASNASMTGAGLSAPSMAAGWGAAVAAAGAGSAAAGAGSGVGHGAGAGTAGLTSGPTPTAQAGRAANGRTASSKARASSTPRPRPAAPAPAPVPSPRTPPPASVSRMQRLLSTLDVPMPLHYQSRGATAATAAPLLTVQRISGQGGAGGGVGGGAKAPGGSRGQLAGDGAGLSDWQGAPASELDRQRSSLPPGRWSYSGHRASAGDSILRKTPPPAGAFASLAAGAPEATAGARPQKEASFGAERQSPIPEQEDRFSACSLADRGPWLRPTSASSSPGTRRPTSSPLPASSPTSPPLHPRAPAGPPSPPTPPSPAERRAQLPPQPPHPGFAPEAPRAQWDAYPPLYKALATASGLEPWMLEVSTGWAIPGAPSAPASASRSPYPSSTPSPLQSAPRPAHGESGRESGAGGGWQGSDTSAPAPRPPPSPATADVAAAVAAAAQRVRERIARPDPHPSTGSAAPRNRHGTALEGSVQLLQSVEHWRTPVFVARGTVRPAKELRQELAALDAMPMAGWCDPLEEDALLACKAEAASRRQAAEAAARAANAAEAAGDAGVGGYWRGRERELLQEAAVLDAGVAPCRVSQDGSKALAGEASACSDGGGGGLQASRSTPSLRVMADVPGRRAARRVGSAGTALRVGRAGGRRAGGGMASRAGRRELKEEEEEEEGSSSEEEEEEEEEEESSSDDD